MSFYLLSSKYCSLCQPPSALWQERILFWQVLALKLGLVKSNFEGDCYSAWVYWTSDHSFSMRYNKSVRAGEEALEMEFGDSCHGDSSVDNLVSRETSVESDRLICNSVRGVRERRHTKSRSVGKRSKVTDNASQARRTDPRNLHGIK